MKKLSFYFLTLLFSSTVLLSSFTNKDVQPISTNPTDEFEILVNYLEANSNFIITDASTAIISADEVKKNIKNTTYKVIDIRSESWYEYGHIKNSANVKAADLLDYFENKINPQDYEKIVMVCYSGQSAAYFTSLLRIAGYKNVYSMKWGMSSWRTDFAENSWLKNTKNDLASKVETTGNLKAEKGEYPTINTGKTEAEDILRARLEKEFATPYKESIIKAEDVFENPSNYYIVSYCDQNTYNKGHIPGAIRYEPNHSSLLTTTDLSTLPKDKKVLVYCPTGQKAAHVVAYLNVLGYDTGNLAYGSNSFMTKILKENNCDPFTNKEINMYPVVE
ncbi:MAG: rhodanese-like domain-containing protein [Bacteroidota bacterium]